MISVILLGQDIAIEHYSDRTDFWVIIPYKSFIFGKNAETAEYQVSMEIKDISKKQVGRHEEKIIVHRHPELSESAIPVRFSNNLKTGNYYASVIVKNLSLGDKRSFGRAFIRSELTQVGQSYMVTRLFDMDMILSSGKLFSLPWEKCSLHQGYSAPIDSLRLFIDGLTKTVVPSGGKITVDLTDMLRTIESPQQFQVTIFEGTIRYKTEPFFYSSWFSYGTIYSPKDQIEQLRYIATQAEWRLMSRLPNTEMTKAIDQFWLAHDPSPGTERNEAREEFYKRVLKADEAYTIHTKLKGWRSDRGRIFIKFGYPDFVSSEVFPDEGHPYIVWNYSKNNKEFVFVDVGGYGQYTLMNKEEEYED